LERQQVRQRTALGGPLSLDRKPTSSSVIDTWERVLDRCVVIETMAEDSVVDLKQSPEKARIVVSSIEICQCHPQNG
jgi:hypothetical protein